MQFIPYSPIVSNVPMRGPCMYESALVDDISCRTAGGRMIDAGGLDRRASSSLYVYSPMVCNDAALTTIDAGCEKLQACTRNASKCFQDIAGYSPSWR